jgi:RNA polymerase sigma factor (sigma-70 family)
MPSNYKAITERNEALLGIDTASRKTQISIFANSTQFVYELLQNAEDCGATDILFKLLGDAIVIEHNGKPFVQADVEGITYFGKGTRPEDLIKTGRFGIGFKSVFAFTATPIIISGTERFKIYDLYRVKEFPYPDHEYPDSSGHTESEDSLYFGTRIILPFNHNSERPRFIEEHMSKEKAYERIKTFLTNPDWEIFFSKRSIQKISWQIYHYETLFTQKIRRNQKIIYINTNEQEVKNPKEVYPETLGSMEIEKIGDENRIKVSGNYKSGQYNYLRFDDNISITDENTGKREKFRISVAFGMYENGKIKPLEVGKVFTYFPAVKEISGLRFHLHAPFVSTPVRDSLLDCAFNNELGEYLANLVAKSMHTIHERGLLDTTFLAVLPNNKDKLPTFYQPIQERLIKEFKTQKLVPMKQGGYTAASECYRAGKYSKDLSNLISDEDLATILGKRGRVSHEILRSLSHHRLLSKEEEQALVRSNSAESKEQLINSNLRLVAAIVHRQFGGCMIEADDLFNEGVKGLKQAANNYTLSHNKFSTFATRYIRNVIQNYIDANQHSTNVSAASPLWIKTPQIGSREDNFLSLLDISEWTIDDFIKELKTQAHTVSNWLKRKPPCWHAELYELLGSFL